MKVSVIIPVYNVQDYLKECVDSVLSVNVDLEIVLVDDGSTDGSGALCDQLAQVDSRIRVVHQENGGLSAARNTGIQNCSGDYVMFLDSDDFLDPKKTEKMLLALVTEPDILMGLYRNYYTDGRYEEENGDGFLAVAGAVSVEEFLDHIPPTGSSCYMIACRFVVRRRLLLENDLFFFTGIYHEDEEWTQRLFCAATSVYVSHEFFYQYRQGRYGAITSTVRPKHIHDSLTIMKRTATLIDRQTNEDKRRYLLYRLSQLYINIIANFSVLASTEKSQVSWELKPFSSVCRRYMAGTRGLVVKTMVFLFGIRCTGFLLSNMRNLFRR